MSAAVLPQMVERNNGIIVNISSATAYSPLSLLSVYSAAKVRVLLENKLTEVLVSNPVPSIIE